MVRPTLAPLETLYETKRGKVLPLPPRLARLYGRLRMPSTRARPHVISNFVTINVLDRLARTPGVGDAQLFGRLDYSMRIWFDLDRLTGLRIDLGQFRTAGGIELAKIAEPRSGDVEDDGNGASAAACGDRTRPTGLAKRNLQHSCLRFTHTRE